MRDGSGHDATIARGPNQIIRKIRIVILQYGFFCLLAIHDHLLQEQLYFILDLDTEIKCKVSREGRLLVAGLPAVGKTRVLTSTAPQEALASSLNVTSLVPLFRALQGTGVSNE